MRARKISFTEEEFSNAVRNSLSVAQVLRCLGLKPSGGNYKTVNFYLKYWNINNNHFTGAAWNKGTRFRKFNKIKPLNEILIENSDYSSTNGLKKRLLKEGIKKYKCEKCNLETWCDLPIPLELNHKNGINTDNRLENLEILCPNCHAQSDFYRGRNKKNYKQEVENIYFNSYSKTIKKCEICSKELKKSRVKYCSYECRNIAAASKKPTVQELQEAFSIYKSFLQVGKFFNVSDNAVRKWCKQYGILNL